MDNSEILTTPLDIDQCQVYTPGYKCLTTLLDIALRKPGVLPSKNEEPIKGTDLINNLRPYLNKSNSDNTIRNYLSQMSRNENSPIAKSSRGHGYYCRFTRDDLEESYQIPSNEDICSNNQLDVLKRDAQREEIFRALYISYLSSINRFPALIDHTKSKRDSKGTNVWRFPDVVGIEWSDGILTQIGEKLRLNRHMAEMKRGSGDFLFNVISDELKVYIDYPSHRKSFFQCVSNSSWANGAQLVVAMKISDAKLVEILRKLGSKHDISIICFNFTESNFDTLPSADVIRNLNDADQLVLLEDFCSEIEVVYKCQKINKLDYSQFNDLSNLSDEFMNISKWIGKCMKDEQAYSLQDFKVKEFEEYEIHNKYAPLGYRH